MVGKSLRPKLDTSPEKQRERARKGGLVRAENFRDAKRLKAVTDKVLGAHPKLPEDLTRVFCMLGMKYEKGKTTNRDAIIAVLTAQALQGDLGSIKMLFEYNQATLLSKIQKANAQVLINAANDPSKVIVEAHPNIEATYEQIDEQASKMGVIEAQDVR